MNDFINSDHYSDRTDGELNINEILGIIVAEAPTMEATVTENEEVNIKESTEDEDETYIKV
jgi:hypothetical protein